MQIEYFNKYTQHIDNNYNCRKEKTHHNIETFYYSTFKQNISDTKSNMVLGIIISPMMLILMGRDMTAHPVRNFMRQSKKQKVG